MTAKAKGIRMIVLAVVAFITIMVLPALSLPMDLFAIIAGIAAPFTVLLGVKGLQQVMYAPRTAR